MRIIHTSDWHLGKLVHQIHMTKDQEYILDQLIEFLRKEQPDVLIIAGDIYDRSVPPIEAVELLDDTLTHIITVLGIKVMAIAGNHDSPDRVGFASKLLEDKGLYISGHIQKDIEPITLEDEQGLVDFYLIPYAEPSIVREVYGDDEIKTHDDAMKAIMKNVRMRMDGSRRNVCVAHCYVTGTDSEGISESVRPLSIGGSETVDVSYFEGFDYVALGHLHRPQQVKASHIRYAGSLLKYSFSEAIQKKSIPLIRLDTTETDISLHTLNPVRDMRVIKGFMKDLVDKDVYDLANREDYVMAILVDQGELVDPFAQLRSVYPNLLSVDREEYDREAGEDKTMAGLNFREKNPGELFTEFYEDISGKELTLEKETIVSQAIDALMMKRRLKG